MIFGATQAKVTLMLTNVWDDKDKQYKKRVQTVLMIQNPFAVWLTLPLVDSAACMPSGRMWSQGLVHEETDSSWRRGWQANIQVCATATTGQKCKLSPTTDSKHKGFRMQAISNSKKKEVKSHCVSIFFFFEDFLPLLDRGSEEADRTWGRGHDIQQRLLAWIKTRQLWHAL